MRIVLGLDVSTKTIGLSIVKVTDDNELKLLQVTHLRLKTPAKMDTVESLFVKVSMFSDELKKYTEYGITDVVIEEPLLSANNQHTVATLLRFNGMISLSCYEKLGVIPQFISSYDARRFGIPELSAVRKFKKNGECNSIEKIRKSLKTNDLVVFGSYMFDCAKKYILWNYISERFPNIQWVYDKHHELKDENFDASDSLICVLGYLNKEKYENVPPQVLSFEEIDTDDGKLVKYRTLVCGEEFDKIIEFDKEEIS